MKPVELFHIGPQKAGTTWVYRCLREHPEIALPPRDTVNYFDIHYQRGREWYSRHFLGHDPSAKLMDPTPTYLRSPYAPERIARENPGARIVVCLRHPVERAFSHYWHEKRKRRYNFRFEEVLENYDLWSNWLESGFYSRFLERYLDHFPRNQILCLLFDDLERDPRRFLDRMLEFAGVSSDFVPSVLDVKVNPSRPVESRIRATARRTLDRVGLWESATRTAKRLRSSGLLGPEGGASDSGGSEDRERLEDQGSDLLDELRSATLPEIDRLEKLMGLDLAEWRSG